MNALRNVRWDKLGGLRWPRRWPKAWKRRGPAVILVLVVTAVVRLLDGGADQGGAPGTVGELRGKPQVIDGDSLRFSGNGEVRLVGIDAPEGRQFCTRSGREYACGREATRALQNLIGRAKVVCDSQRRDQHDRALATCWTGAAAGEGLNINRDMVVRGWAVAFGGRYRNEERRARDERRGLWAGTFERPGDWRRSNPR